METMDAVTQALTLLDAHAEDSIHPTAMIVLSPESGKFILGNRGGFIRLAVAALKAAQGEEQSFKGKAWVNVEDLDWGVAGLKPDPSAHIYLPTKVTRFPRLRHNMFGLFLLLLISLCFVIGVAAIVRWLFLHA